MKFHGKQQRGYDLLEWLKVILDFTLLFSKDRHYKNKILRTAGDNSAPSWKDHGKCDLGFRKSHLNCGVPPKSWNI
jgi:hypothetical protein